MVATTLAKIPRAKAFLTATLPPILLQYLSSELSINVSTSRLIRPASTARKNISYGVLPCQVDVKLIHQAAKKRLTHDGDLGMVFVGTKRDGEKCEMPSTT